MYTLLVRPGEKWRAIPVDCCAPVRRSGGSVPCMQYSFIGVSKLTHLLCYAFVCVKDQITFRIRPPLA